MFPSIQHSALLTVGAQYIFIDLVNGWMSKQCLYNSPQRNPKMWTELAGRLLRELFVCWLLIFVAKAAETERLLLILQIHLPVQAAILQALAQDPGQEWCNLCLWQGVWRHCLSPLGPLQPGSVTAGRQVVGSPGGFSPLCSDSGLNDKFNLNHYGCLFRKWQKQLSYKFLELITSK